MILRYADTKVAAAMEQVERIMYNQTDPRAALKAADMIINHEKELWQHENPPTQKHQIDGELNINIKFNEPKNES